MVGATDRRPRVALVAHDVTTPGGMERVYTELLRRAAGRVQFTVVSSTLSADLQPLVDWRRVPVLRRPLPLKFALFFVLGGLRVRRARCDLVHTIGAIVPNRVDVITVQHCHAGVRRRTGSLVSPELPLARRLNSGLSARLALLAERWCYRRSRVRVVTASSSGIAEELERDYPAVAVTMTPNGVDRPGSTLDPPSRAEMRQAEGIRDDAATVAIFVGGDWYRKGLAIAIRALELARRAGGPSPWLWVVGRGDQRRFTSLAQRCGVADRVRFLGRRPNVLPLYQAADLFLLPSRYEGFSLVAFEAASCGLPVVATRVGCIQELVGRDQAGIIVEPTPGAVAAALTRLAADPALRDQLGKAARLRVQAFGWDRTVQSVLDVYTRLLEEPVVSGSATPAAIGSQGGSE